MRHAAAIWFTLIALSFTGFSQTPETSVASYLSELNQRGQLTAGDTNFKIASQHTSSTSGIHHIYFEQTIDGIPVFGTASAIHLAPGGKRVKADFNFQHNATEKVVGSRSPGLTAEQAILKVALQLEYNTLGTIEKAREKYAGVLRDVYKHPGISQAGIPADIQYFITADGEIKLVWDLFIEEVGSLNRWILKADASRGEILYKQNLTEYCSFDLSEETTLNYNSNLYDIPDYCEEEEENEPLNCRYCYEVIPYPHPNPYSTERKIRLGPLGNDWSPFGWHDFNGEPGAEFWTTWGNNTEVHIMDNPWYRPNGGPDISFINYPFSQNYSELNRYRDAAATNVFYWVNKIHDILYVYGFDEPAGNFQHHNYGNGGMGYDEMVVFAQSEDRFCNAAYAGAIEGSRSFISLFLCNNKDSAFDATVIIHEYIHGLLQRVSSTGELGCFASQENGTEGWCDWYGVAVTMLATDQNNTSRPIANYFFDQGPNGGGVRKYPYNTDMTVNPLTYNSMADDPRPHAKGTVWGSILWEVTWALVDRFGYDPDIENFTGTDQDAGNIRALAIMTQSLKLVPCNPGAVDMRNAIMLANQYIYDGEGDCDLWGAFAKRGLGMGAEQGNPDDLYDGVESFEMPNGEAEFYFPENTICLYEGVTYNRTKGLPYGGVYSGPGVTDDGNGATYTFDPEAAGVGVHTITYEVPDSECSVASSASDIVEVLDDPIPPEALCPSRFSDISATNDAIPLSDFTDRIFASDNCPGVVEIRQEPPPGALVQPGVIMIDFYYKDLAGNEGVCSVPLHLYSHNEIDASILVIDIHPNPVGDLVYLEKRTPRNLDGAMIYDVHGRIVKTYDLSNVESETELNVASLITGIYFIRFELESEVVVKQIIKK